MMNTSLFKTFRADFRFIAIFLLIILAFGNVSSSRVSGNAAIVRPAQAQTTTWVTLENEYPEATFRDVEFINSSHGWVVGILNPNSTSGGVILHTKDGGDTWETQLIDEAQLFRQVDVVNERTVWVTGFGCLYFTNDSGISWHTSVVYNSLSTMSTVKFLNESHGWTATMQMLFRTSDGGQTWQNVTGWAFDDHPRDMHFLTENDAWAIGYDGIYHSEDGGETWVDVFDRGGWSLSFPEEGIAWGVSDGFLIHMKQDQTWETLTVPGRLPSFRLMSPYCSDIQFIDDHNGWIVGTEIPVMHTPDGGSSWYQQSVPSSIGYRMMAVCFVDELHGWVVGSDGTILRTFTGGNLDAPLLSGQQDLLFIGLGLIGIIVVISVGRYVLRRRRKGTNIVQAVEESEPTTELH